jgi:hypothetical protein
MKTIKNLTLTLLLSVLTILISNGAVLSTEISNNKSSISNAVTKIKSNQICVKAVIRNGELIPLIQLPEIVIYGEKKSKFLLPAIKNSEGVIPIFELPEVVISVEKINNISTFKTVEYKGKYIRAYDLPEVEVMAEKVNYEILSNNINMFPAVLYEGHYIASVDLPIIEITTERNENLISENYKQVNSEKQLNLNESYRSNNSILVKLRMKGLVTVISVLLLRNEIEKLYWHPLNDF